MFLQRCGAHACQNCSTTDNFPVIKMSSVPKFCCQLLLPHSELSVRVRTAQIFHEERQRISVRNTIRKWTHAPLVDALCSQTGDSSSLEARVTLTRASSVEVQEAITRRELLLISFQCSSTWFLIGCVLNSVYLWNRCSWRSHDYFWGCILTFSVRSAHIGTVIGSFVVAKAHLFVHSGI
jgi:hypothetical protein